MFVKLGDTYYNADHIVSIELTASIIKEGVKLVAAGMNPTGLDCGMCLVWSEHAKIVGDPVLRTKRPAARTPGL